MSKKKNRWLSGAFNRVAPPPAAPRDNTVDILHGQKVPDPFRPLEALDAPATTRWVDAQNARFEQFIADVPSRDAAAQSFMRLRAYPYEGIPLRRGLREFRWVQPAGAAQYIYQVKDSPVAAWRVLLDPATLGQGGDKVAIEGTTVSNDGRLVAYTYAENGSDRITLGVRDVETGADLPDILPDLKFTNARWDRDDKSFVYARPVADDSGRLVLMRHVLGTDAAKDAEIYCPPEAQGLPAYSVINDREFVSVRIGTLPHTQILTRAKPDEAFKTWLPGGVACHRVIRVKDNEVWLTTDQDAPRQRVIAVALDAPDMNAARTIIPEDPQGGNLNWAMVHQDRIITALRQGPREILRVHGMDGQFLHDAPIPPGMTFSVSPVRKDDHALMLTFGSARESGAIMAYDPVRNTLTRQRDSLAPADLRDCVVEQLYATSRDGTRVPFTLIRDPKTKLDGTAAVRLYGYGGFNLPETLSYNSTVAHWVRSGGIYAVAQLRGGGEFGRDWYDGGRLHNKQNVFDDFAACARMLIRRKYTSAQRLVIEGGSNGGLLTLATMLQQPQLFGAVISHVPVTDMLRFHKFTVGAFWKSDYGDPEANADDFRVSMGYSPLHNVRARKLYPPCLVLTGDHDDRVVPSHAYKFMATLQDRAHRDTLAFLRVARDAGHGAGQTLADGVAESAAVFAFIEKTIGPVDQAAYKAALARRQPPAAAPQQGR